MIIYDLDVYLSILATRARLTSFFTAQRYEKYFIYASAGGRANDFYTK